MLVRAHISMVHVLVRLHQTGVMPFLKTLQKMMSKICIIALDGLFSG